MRDSLLLRIIHLGVVVTRSLTEDMAPYGLSPVELAILLACKDDPDCTAVMIAKVIPVDTPSISRSVHQLVQKGLLTRRRSETDRRLVFLRLSPEGENMVDGLLLLLRGVEQRLLQALDEEQAHAYGLYTEALLARVFPR